MKNLKKSRKKRLLMKDRIKRLRVTARNRERLVKSNNLPKREKVLLERKQNKLERKLPNSKVMIVFLEKRRKIMGGVLCA